MLPASDAAAPSDDDVFLVSRKIDKGDIDLMYDQLELTPEQKLELERNRQQYHRKIKDLSRRIDDLQAQTTLELEKPNLDDEKLSRLQSELNEAQHELSSLRLEGIKGVRGILTPEQYRTFNSLTR